ncbi:hypothetical protein QFZ71_002422 [Streptomyces sp. V2I9]|nr:hypothetical protein [Streptomyces sp. V2I9]
MVTVSSRWLIGRLTEETLTREFFGVQAGIDAAASASGAASGFLLRLSPLPLPPACLPPAGTVCVSGFPASGVSGCFLSSPPGAAGAAVPVAEPAGLVPIAWSSPPQAVRERAATRAVAARAVVRKRLVRMAVVLPVLGVLDE